MSKICIKKACRSIWIMFSQNTLKLFKNVNMLRRWVVGWYSWCPCKMCLSLFGRERTNNDTKPLPKALLSCSYLAGLFRRTVKHLHPHTYETISIVKCKTRYGRTSMVQVVCQTVKALRRLGSREERGRQEQEKTARWAPVPTRWTKAWYEQRSNQCYFLFRHAWATAGHQQLQNDSNLFSKLNGCLVEHTWNSYF